MKFLLGTICVLLAVSAEAQVPRPGAPSPFARPQGLAAPPAIITLQDALTRARTIDTVVQSALGDVSIAVEERRQAKAARLPSVSASGQYIGTQGNGITPNGRFVGADGVHVYRSLATVHQEFSAGTILNTDFKRAAAAQALASARVDIARRGLDVTVAEHYYSL